MFAPHIGVEVQINGAFPQVKMQIFKLAQFRRIFDAGRLRVFQRSVQRSRRAIFYERIPLFASWLYVSNSLLGSNVEVGILDIRRAADIRNGDLGLTGVLIFSGYHFAQLLEGPESCLETMKASICGDARHTGIVTLQSGLVAKRRYARWKLAYAGHATCIDGVLANAAYERNPTELLSYMDQFAKLQ